jgi:carbamoyl-phosphate synthase large subunit
MPKRTDIKRICVIGAGPIVIGQACEFDYSGTQACKALREEGYEVVLINSNPATIMTDPETADATYIEPLVPEEVAEILRRERPDALLPTMGGQTALNLALELHERGLFEELGIEMLGAGPESIHLAEDREAFKGLMDELGLETAVSGRASSLEQAREIAERTGIPCVLRPSFTLGGVGGGIVHDPADFDEMVSWALEQSPVGEVLIEESLLGWKEYEMEVMRDLQDRVVIVCAIENLDPMGIHTGDSVTVAPAQTLTDREYQAMRDASIKIIRGVGVACGGSNIQFTVDPMTGRMAVIEMNPRVSRSSALASKATGFPIARIAALLAVGLGLEEIPNSITHSTPACFEPTLDYVVTKIPRFAFEKFTEADDTLTTQMKSVGEVMAIGSTFGESLLKALRGLEGGTGSLAASAAVAQMSEAALFKELRRPQPGRLLLLAEALRRGATVEQVHEASRVDPWFLAEIGELVDEEARIERLGADALEPSSLKWAKHQGMSDRHIAALVGVEESEVRGRRREHRLAPVFKRVDTCAAEFEAHTPYLDSTWAQECEAEPDTARRVIILGSGPNRIGQGIEFDYCCVKASWALRETGCVSIMVNCNPETVSTDHDTSDRLYFEPIDLESVLTIVDQERPEGVIVQFGGQTPLRLARGLAEAGVPILGTSPEVIEMAEDRARFSAFSKALGLRTPRHEMAYSVDEAVAAAASLGFPVLVRPSHVLGGRGMAILEGPEALDHYLATFFLPSGEPADPRALPLLVDEFLSGAVEVDVDAVCDGETAIIGGVMEQVERAGVHSGDSACLLPPATLSAQTIEALSVTTRRIALELGVVGLINVQYALVSDCPEGIYVLEVNPRASRTVPFVSKATGTCMATLATKIMLGETLKGLGIEDLKSRGQYCKEVVLPLSRFAGASPLLSPEMRSTGEVMAEGSDPWEAFVRAQLAADNAPGEGPLYVDADPACFSSILSARPWLGKWELTAPEEIAAALAAALEMEVRPVGDGLDPQTLGAALVIHRGWSPEKAVRFRRLQATGTAYFTTPESFIAWCRGSASQWKVRSLQETARSVDSERLVHPRP